MHKAIPQDLYISTFLLIYLKKDTINMQLLKRRYLIYNPKKPQDVFRLFVFIFYTITFVKPLIDSIRGYFIVRDVAWFLHPLFAGYFFMLTVWQQLRNS